MKKKNSYLQDRVGFWLRRLSNEMHNAFLAKLEKVDISIPEWCVLNILFHDKQAVPSSIAEQVGIDRGAISRTVEKLVQRGFIERGVGQDRRNTPLELTKKARELIPKLIQMAEVNDQEFFSMLESKEKKVLQHILYKIAYHIGIKERS